MPPDGTIYRDCESPKSYTAPTTFVNRTYVNSPARSPEHQVVLQLEPLYGQNLVSGNHPSQGSLEPRSQAESEVGPSSLNTFAGEWEIRPSSTLNTMYLELVDLHQQSLNGEPKS
jgi:hypothetical protein